MTTFFRIFTAHARRPGYYAWLAIATVGYFAASRLVQDWVYRRLPPNVDRIDIFPLFPVLPEPYEIPLYLLSYVVIPVAALALTVAWGKLAPSFRWPSSTVWVVAIAMAAGAILFLAERVDVTRLTQYLATHDIRHVLWLLFTKRIFVLRLAFAAAGIFLAAAWWFGWQPSLARFRAALADARYGRLVLWVVLVLAFIIFTPNFRYEAGTYNYYLGTLNDMLHGKALFYETSNQYGFVSLYVTAAIFATVLPLGYATLSLVFSASYFLFYVALYTALRRWFRLELYAAVGIFAILATHYFLQADPFRSAVFYPGMVPLRNGFFVIVLLALLAYLKRPTGVRRELTLVLAAFAPFWSVDAGVYTFLATFIVFGYEKITEYAGRLCTVRLRGAVLIGLRMVGYAIGFFAAINLANVAIYGRFPRWSFVFEALTWYEGGFGKIPMPFIGVFALVVLTYAAALVWIACRTFRRESVSLVFLFVTIYGIFSFLYYVGNSAWGYIPPVLTPLVLVILGLAYELIFRIGVVGPPALVRLWWALLVFVGFLLVAKIPMDFAGRDYRHIIANLTAVRAEDRALFADARELARRFPSAPRLPVFHLQDTKLLLFADRINYFDIYDNFNVIARSRLKGILRTIAMRQPEYLIVGKQKDMRIEAFVEGIRANYAPVESLQTLDIYRRTPHVQ